MKFLNRSKSTGSKPTDSKPAKAELIPLKKPTRTFYIHTHSEWTKDTKVIDITAHINTPSNDAAATELHFATEEFQKRTLEIGMSKTIAPVYHMRRDAYFTRSAYMTQVSTSSPSSFSDLTSSSSSPSAPSSPPPPPPSSSKEEEKAEQRLLDLKTPYWSHKPTIITFPASSPHCTHPLSMKPVRGAWGDQESFVLDSVEYAWKHDRETGNWSWKRYKLIKHWSDRRVEVAKFWEPLGWKKGGTLVVDEGEVDVVIAVATCLVMLMKKRQKDAERSV